MLNLVEICTKIVFNYGIYNKSRLLIMLNLKWDSKSRII